MGRGSDFVQRRFSACSADGSSGGCAVGFLSIACRKLAQLFRSKCLRQVNDLNTETAAVANDLILTRTVNPKRLTFSRRTSSRPPPSEFPCSLLLDTTKA